jgi:uncharacterized protein YfiM (DUF2279 family)
MADETGALNAIKDSSAPAVEAQPDFAQNALDRVQKARAEFDAITAQKNKHYEDLLASLDSRKNRPFNPMLMKLAAGMLQPTKTGSFGESLGYAAAGMSDQAEKEFAQQQQDAKLRFELQSKIAEQKQQDISRRASQDILGGVGFGEAPPALPTPSALPAAGEVPAQALSVEPPVIMTTGSDGQIAPALPESVVATQVAAAPSAKTAPVKTETAKVNPAERAFKEFTEGNAQYRANVKSYAPEAYEAFMAEEKRRLDAAENARKERKTRAETRITVKVGGAEAIMDPEDNEKRLKAIREGDIEGADKIHSEYGLPSYFVKMENGKYRAKSPTEFEAEKAEAIAATSTTPVEYPVPELGGSFKMLPRKYMALERAREQGPEAVQKWVDSVQGITGKSAKTIKPIPDVATAAAEAAGKETTAKEEAKIQVELGANLMREGKNASELRNTWKSLQSLATSNPKIFDALKDPSIQDALLRTANAGVSTPWGSISINPTDLTNAVKNYTDTTGKKLTSNDLVAYNLALQDMAKLVVQERRLSKGEGAISDKETDLFARLGAMPSDSSTTIRLKSELAIERANAVEKVGKAFYKFKKDTGGNYDDFVNESPVYKTIKDNYDNRLEQIRQSNARFLSGVPLGESKPIGEGKPSDGPVDKDAVRRLTGRK